jgi:HAD superfamily hydrolase (TIGR01457 family)
MKHLLTDKELFVLDMDGTFYLEDKPIEGALEFLDVLKKSGKRFLFFTNNSSKSISDYIKKLTDMGVEADENTIYSSGSVTIDYLKKNRSGRKVYLIGTQSLREGFMDKGIILSEDNPDIVVLGFDTTLDYDKIFKGCTFIREGAEFMATHPDLNCPIKGGMMPDTGSFIRMFTASTGVKPIIMGKPFSYTVEAIESATGISRDKMVFVGDRLETDIAIGVNNGATAVLVMTGATDKEILEASVIKPTFHVPSIASLINKV